MLVGDYGSSDETINICKKYGAQVIDATGSRAHIRAKLAKMNEYPVNLWLEPWEIIQSSPQSLLKFQGGVGACRIISKGIVNVEPRVWTGDVKFENPVFETITENGDVTSLVLLSRASHDVVDSLKELRKWEEQEPLTSAINYFKAFCYLSQGRYVEFLSEAKKFLFANKGTLMQSTMLRYYMAAVSLNVYKKSTQTLQLLNLCLCGNPLMAEFWCLTGDVYYHLHSDRRKAAAFYENAISLGSQRPNLDYWPMEIAKYRRYPEKMIDVCKRSFRQLQDGSQSL